MSENTREWIGISAPGEGKIHNIVISSKGRGWVNCKFCKIADSNHRDITGIYYFPQTIITGNIK